MVIGTILLVIAAILVIFGVGQRVLDRMGLTDRQAIFWMLAIIIGGFIPNIALGSRFEMNLGGFLIPFVLGVWLFFRADTAGEKGRAFLAAIGSAAIVWLIGVFFPNEPETMPFDVNILYGIAAGLFACLLGRSRRAAFIGGSMGIILADVAQAVMNWMNGIDQKLVLGGAGAFDAIVISGILAVMLRELLGEGYERMSRPTRDVEPAVLDAHRDEEDDDAFE